MCSPPATPEFRIRQRTVTAWALGAFLLAQVVPAIFFRRDSMLGGAATVFSFVGTAHFLTGTRVDEENIVLSGCMLGLGANVIFTGSVVTGFLKFSRATAILSGFAAANGFLAVVALAYSQTTFTPLPGCALWLGSMCWLCIGSWLAALSAKETPTSSGSPWS